MNTYIYNKTYKMKKLLCTIIAISFFSNLFAQWQQTNYPTSTLAVLSIAISGANIFASSGNGKVSLSSDNGSSWLSKNILAANTSPVNSLLINGGNIFAGTVGNGVFLSANNGNSWIAKNNGLTNLQVYSLVISGTSIFAGTHDGVFISNDNGNNWTSVGLTGNFVYSIAISGSNIFAGSNNGVYLSINNGASWAFMNSGLPATVNSFAVDNNNVFAGTNGMGMSYTSNNGISWSGINNGLPSNSYIYSLAISGTNIFAGANNGGKVYFSPNNGSVWYDVSSGIISAYNVQVLTLFGSDIYAGMGGGIGIWKRPLSEIVTNVSEIKSELSFLIGPNPFNTATIINFAKEQKNTEIKIIDINGKVINILYVTGKELSINRGEISKGIYNFQISDENKNVVNRKIIID